MDTIQQAEQVLRDAEMALRDLIGQGLKQQRYADIADVARLADGVARLLNKQISPTLERVVAPPSPVGQHKIQPPAPKQSVVSKRNKAEFPRFERDGDRLLKIGWSKKNKEVYEHRAPRQAVIAFVRHLASRVQTGRVFVMEDLLPVPDIASGDEVPAYQSYMTLAWLRAAGAIEKKGRDGYVLRMNAIAESGLDNLWDQLPERAA